MNEMYTIQVNIFLLKSILVNIDSFPKFCCSITFEVCSRVRFYRQVRIMAGSDQSQLTSELQWAVRQLRGKKFPISLQKCNGLQQVGCSRFTAQYEPSVKIKIIQRNFYAYFCLSDLRSFASFDPSALFSTGIDYSFYGHVYIYYRLTIISHGEPLSLYIYILNDLIYTY